MQYSTKCQCCWHKVSAYTYRLNKWLVQALVKLIEFGKPAKTTDLPLSKAQYWSFNKLQFRDLIRKDDEGKREPTCLAKQFYIWFAQLFDTVAMLGGEKLPYDHHARSTHKGEIKRVFINDITEVRYKQKNEYQKERVGLFGYERTSSSL